MIISDLRTVPEFAGVIADRNWNAWWTESDTSLSDYERAIVQMASGQGIPTALVAYIDEKYIGSVLLIDSDLDARPQLSPWIAGLWVEPEFRSRKVAAKLIQAACSEALRLGYRTGYLCATPRMSPYYLARGFDLLETDVEGLNVFTISTV